MVRIEPVPSSGLDHATLRSVPAMPDLGLLNEALSFDAASDRGLHELARRFPGVQTLYLVGAPLRSLDFVHALPNLTSLSVQLSDLSGLDGLRGHPRLHTLELQGNSIEHTAALAELPRLARVYLGANPLSPGGVAIAQALRERHVHGGSGARIFVQIPSQEELGLNRTLHKRGYAVRVAVASLGCEVSQIGPEEGAQAPSTLWTSTDHVRQVLALRPSTTQALWKALALGAAAP